MAISRFTQESTTNLSLFYQWLNDNKNGTFLENLTIENTTTTNANDTITISDTNATLTIISRGTANGQKVVVYSSSAISKTIKTYASTTSSAYLVKAILNNKGLILQFYGVYDNQAGHTSNSCGIAVTVDSNGELSLISTSTSTIPTSDGMNVSSLYVYTPSSTSAAGATCRPFFNANLTCIAPITAQGVDNDLSLPYAYAALRTQLLSEGLQGVTINGADYITNGVWYIKDGD